MGALLNNIYFFCFKYSRRLCLPGSKRGGFLAILLCEYSSGQVWQWALFFFISSYELCCSKLLQMLSFVFIDWLLNFLLWFEVGFVFRFQNSRFFFRIPGDFAVVNPIHLSGRIHFVPQSFISFQTHKYTIHVYKLRMAGPE